MRYRDFDRPRLDGGTRVLGGGPGGAEREGRGAPDRPARDTVSTAAPIDGVSGPLTRGAVLRLQRTSGIRPTGRVGHATRCELGKLGKPLLGQRSLTRGRVGWDVSVLEFRLVASTGSRGGESTDASMPPQRARSAAFSGHTGWARTASPELEPSARSFAGDRWSASQRRRGKLARDGPADGTDVDACRAWPGEGFISIGAPLPRRCDGDRPRQRAHAHERHRARTAAADSRWRAGATERPRSPWSDGRLGSPTASPRGRASSRSRSATT